MKSIRLFIPGNFLDSYIYAGHLFAIFSDGTIRAIPLNELTANAAATQSPTLAWLLKISFHRNDWLENEQSHYLLSPGGARREVARAWRKASSKGFVAEPPLENWQMIGTLPELKINDFKLYGMKVMVGSRYGVFEAGIRTDERKKLSINNKLNKITDVPTTGVNAKGGSMVISGGVEGLFHGAIGHPTHRTILHKSGKVPISFRTAWMQFDLINYMGQKDFSYLENEVKKTKERTHLYSRTDESSEKTTITEMGKRVISGEELMPKVREGAASPIYSFNSGGSFFQILESGEVQVYAVSHRKKDHPRVALTPRSLGSLRGRRLSFRPLSVQFGNKRTIIEMFDRVSVLEENRLEDLEKLAAISLRTFPASRRYRNLILITTETGIVMHSLLPRNLE